ncbi:MAG: hypothetical protein R3E66_16160 [bacterium]
MSNTPEGQRPRISSLVHMQRLALYLLVLNVACTDEPGTDPVSTNTSTFERLTSLPAEDFRRRYAEMVCHVGFECMHGMPGELSIFGDLETCLANTSVRNTTFSNFLKVAEGLDYGVRQGTIAYDPVLAANCINEIHEQSCDSSWGIGYTPVAFIFNESCQSFSEGTLRDGETCANGRECLSGICAQAAPGSCGGVCAPPLPLTCGLPGAPVSVCIEGEQFCDEDGTCALKGDVGDPCNPNGAGTEQAKPCRDGLFCNAEFPQIGVCERLESLDTGTPCFHAEACLPGLFCNSARRCSNREPALGEECAFALPVTEQCAGTAICGLRDGSYVCMRSESKAEQESCIQSRECQKGLTCLSNTCKRIPSLGEPCDDYCNDGAVCIVDLEIGELVCQERKALGDLCTYDFECALGLMCLNQACHPQGQAQVGESCVDAWNCQSFKCSEAGVCLPETCL